MTPLTCTICGHEAPPGYRAGDRCVLERTKDGWVQLAMDESPEMPTYPAGVRCAGVYMADPAQEKG
jgi:hypothetical protein